MLIFAPENDVYLTINNDGIPVALLQGDRDGTLAIRASLTYDKIKNPPTALINIKGANHFSITNTNNPAGAIPDPIDTTLNQDVAILISCTSKYKPHITK